MKMIALPTKSMFATITYVQKSHNNRKQGQNSKHIQYQIFAYCVK